MEVSTLNLHADLIQKCRWGDPSAQYELYRLYSKAMYNTALRIVGVQEDAEDVLQEAFVSAFKNLSSYREDATFGAWLKRIVINRALSHLRKQRLMILADEETDLPDESSDENADMDYTVEQIKNGVQLLPSGFRSVLTLYLFEGYDHQEISEILGISESTSKTQYKRAKEKLKAILRKEVNYG